MQPETLAVSYVLMMIGGGSAGTAGGIKVTTFLVLGFVVWAEIRGEPDVDRLRAAHLLGRPAAGAHASSCWRSGFVGHGDAASS